MVRLQADAAYVVAEGCVAQTQRQLALAAVVRRIELGVALMEAVIVHDGCIHTCNDHEALCEAIEACARLLAHSGADG